MFVVVTLCDVKTLQIVMDSRLRDWLLVKDNAYYKVVGDEENAEESLLSCPSNDVYDVHS